MAKLLKLRRGTTSQHSSFTGAEGEVTIDTTKDTAVVHDGSTAGGHPLVKENAEVTSTGIASNVVDEDNLKISNSPTNGQFLSAQSGNTGGLTWATPTTYTHPNHSGEVTSSADGAQTIADNIVDEANLKVSNAPTNGQFLSAQSGNTGGLTWADVDLSTYAPKASPALTGTATGVNLTLSGDLTVNGTTTTVASTNTTLTDNLIELNSGASSNANDAGILIERGSTGDNAIIAWDESADKFTVGTTTATASDTGDLTITTGTLVANVEGDLNGTAGVATTITTALEASDTSCNVVFTTAATGDLAPKTSTGLTYNSATGALAATSFSGDGSGLSNLPATSPAGSNNTIQFNNNGSFGGTGDIFRNNSNTGIYATGGFTDTIGNVRYVGSQYLYANNWVNSTSQVGRCLRAQGNFYVGSITTGAIVSVVNDTGSDITISRQTSQLYNTGTGDNNSSYTLTSRGMVTFWYAGSSTVYMSGSGVS